MKNKIQSIIETSYNNYTEVEKKIADTIVNSPTLIIDNSIVELSKLIFVSKTSISRFCLKINIPGYKELRYMLSQNIILENESLHFTSMIDFFQSDYLKIINKVKLTVSESEIKSCVKYITNASKVYIIGVGSSGFQAMDFSFRLQRLGINSQAITDSHFISIQSKISTENDLFICFSLSGETRIICHALNNLKLNNVKSILISQFMRSSASIISDILILAPQKSNLALTDSISDKFSLILITDIIFHYIFISNPAEYKEIFDKTIINHQKQDNDF